MGRQTRTPRAGSGNAFVSPNVVTSSSALIAIPNYGDTDLSAYTAGEYVLDAPTQGVRKTLFSLSSSALAKVVRLSTGATVKVGNQLATQINMVSTVGVCVRLIGYNSTQWVLESVYPPEAAVNSTGIIIGTS